MPRDEKVMIRLSSEVKEKFEKMASEYGMSLSAFGAFIIGSYLRQQERMVEPMVGQMSEVLKSVLTQYLAEDRNVETDVVNP